MNIFKMFYCKNLLSYGGGARWESFAGGPKIPSYATGPFSYLLI